jgi:nucleotide-binding universal stress UspA family protein
MFKRILAATDGSDNAAKALQAAIKLAWVNKGALIVLNVFNSQETFAGRQSGGLDFARAEHLQGDYAEAEQILPENVLTSAKIAIGKRPHMPRIAPASVGRKLIVAHLGSESAGGPRGRRSVHLLHGARNRLAGRGAEGLRRADFHGRGRGEAPEIRARVCGTNLAALL